MARGKVAKKTQVDPLSAKTPSLLVEVAWEVCQQVGGIYTVIRTKVPQAVSKRGDDYLLIGPWNAAISPQEFGECEPTGPFAEAFREFTNAGFPAKFGRWLVEGKPQVILMDHRAIFHRLGEIQYEMWEKHGVSSEHTDELFKEVLAFGHLTREFLRILGPREQGRHRVIAHFHEWMAGSHLPAIRRDRIPVTTVFTTHATFLGRCLAVNDSNFYDRLPFYRWHDEARKLNIEPQNLLERHAAHSAHVFTTVSEVTALECRHLLGREVDLALPNGLHMDRFVSLHEFQNLHQQYKTRIQRFVRAHFFPSYPIDLDNTLYFFTSGRYEYRNKGFDITLEALARLNHRMKMEGSKMRIVMFIVTKRPTKHIIHETLASLAVMDEMKSTVHEVAQQVDERLFENVAMRDLPSLDELVDENVLLRLRRFLQAWRTKNLPPVVTHNLVDDQHDEILNQIRAIGLHNRPDDPVKVVYHPDFVNASNPLWGMDYDQFVRGCHLGIFPSYYEPWGYTPLECVARGVPAVTSDFSGFGAYVLSKMPEAVDAGIHVSKRRIFSWEEACNQLVDYMHGLVRMDRRQRIQLRNRIENLSDHFDWSNLGRYYDEAYALALDRIDD